MRIRYPIENPQGRRLRVLIYARYSTDEQDKTSIASQYLLCRRFLSDNGIKDAIIVELCDEEKSGELKSRPGIDLVREGVEASKWDLILAEDSSRLFRNFVACFELVETAVDLGLRVICINDDVDTAEEDWELRLHEAQRHHVESNKFLRRRLARTIRGRWEMGAAVGTLRTGYRRIPSVPAKDGLPAEGPHYDELDPEQGPLVFEAYERVARDEERWHVAEWANQVGLRKCDNAKSPIWTATDIIRMIRRTIYHGVDRHRVRIVKKERRTGKKTTVPNPKSTDIWSRPMPHLRIVPDWLYTKANEVITKACTHHGTRPGENRRHSGVPRDSRGPLSKLACCPWCKGKMYVIEGRYKCADSRDHSCKMKGSALRSLVHERISQAICDRLLADPEPLNILTSFIQDRWQDYTPLKKERERKQRDLLECQAKCNRLGVRIESGDKRSDTLVALLEQREADLASIRASIGELTHQLGIERVVPTGEEIEQHIRDARSKILSMDREAGSILRKLVDGPIWFVPYQQFQSNKVVLRAEFRLRLTNLLPAELLTCLVDNQEPANSGQIEVADFRVDLFEPSNVPKHAVRAWELNQKGMSVFQIGKELKIPNTTAQDAKLLGKAMAEAGITDPYIRLNEPPAKASRWRYERRRPKDAPESDAA